MWTIGYIHYITNKIAYITYSHVDQDIPYQLKCDKGLFHAWSILMSFPVFNLSAWKLPIGCVSSIQN